MKNIALAGFAVVFGGIGGTYALVSAGTSKTHKAYKNISRIAEKKIQLRFSGYSIKNPKSTEQKAYNETVNILYRSDLDDDHLYMLLDTMKEQILLGDYFFQSWVRDELYPLFKELSIYEKEIAPYKNWR